MVHGRSSSKKRIAAVTKSYVNPWLVNFGKRPNLTATTSGSDPQINTVVGTTSWGSTSTGPKSMGAAPFLSTNIKALVTGACSANPGAC